jgi:CubicO group peptidase (beta-lactamase class C family)
MDMLSGTHEPGFEPLARALDQVLSRPPHGGGALSIYQDGRKVFDMWGGARDDLGRPWEERTPSVSFSTTKGVASTALHILVDRNLVHYDERVAHYWPEFAQNGKAQITVRQLLSHSAGLYDVRNVLTFEELLDWDTAVRRLAAASVAHPPGALHAYHAVTWGHLVGELVRRVSGRPFSAFVHEEIAQPLGLHDFWVGAPDEAIARAARLKRKPEPSKAAPLGGKRVRREGRKQALRLLERGLSLVGVPLDFKRMRDSFAPRGAGDYDFSSPEVLRACLPSFNGLFTARDIARMYAALAAGGSLDGARLMSPETLHQATELHSRKPDSVVVFPMGWRLGYHSVPTVQGFIRGAFGHFGYGGSGAWASPEDQASLGFVVNAGAGTPLGDLRLVKLSSVAISCVRARRRG